MLGDMRREVKLFGMGGDSLDSLALPQWRAAAAPITTPSALGKPKRWSRRTSRYSHVRGTRLNIVLPGVSIVETYLCMPNSSAAYRQ